MRRNESAWQVSHNPAREPEPTAGTLRSLAHGDLGSAWLQPCRKSADPDRAPIVRLVHQPNRRATSGRVSQLRSVRECAEGRLLFSHTKHKGPCAFTKRELYHMMVSSLSDRDVALKISDLMSFTYYTDKYAGRQPFQ